MILREIGGTAVLQRHGLQLCPTFCFVSCFPLIHVWFQVSPSVCVSCSLLLPTGRHAWLPSIPQSTTPSSYNFHVLADFKPDDVWVLVVTSSFLVAADKVRSGRCSSSSSPSLISRDPRSSWNEAQSPHHLPPPLPSVISKLFFSLDSVRASNENNKAPTESWRIILVTQANN